MALVLTRRPGEKILIGDDITITFQGFNGNSAVLAIDAPKNILIIRDEIKDRKFEPKTTSERKKKAPFLKAHAEPRFEKPKTALAGAMEVIREEVKALS